MGKTRDNLLAAFAGESQARNKYTFFAAVAKKEGLVEVARFFEETAQNEKEHAEQLFKLLGALGDTAANLKAAMEGETYEYADMYPEFAKIAREEGEIEAAELFERLVTIEKFHAQRYQKLLEMVTQGKLLKRDTAIRWQCSECGFIVEGTEPPEVCPVCKHAKGYYMPLSENY
ncbi:rubrerythrin [Carboxydothermus hydrogenoformans]|uniref:Rubrerythrin n=1 Tax=Carboxydothermus hydrogenoformans (strain ATCC BAA-161 / DSM 6008 / Z-2901) TaxID=246194 RepID=Q3A8Z3_CARHZ|nr:rubrerythrin family protein [Carboxydothermus hydrogenoformans]ABB13988.1 rubrerythrin [Carboxydothermus hydrogenoformans Z-2901]